MTIDADTLLLLTAYHDGELSPGEALAMERRLAVEPELEAYLGRLRDLSSGLSDVLPGEAAPERLRGAIFASISDELAREDAATRQPAIHPARHAAPWPAIAATLLVGVLGGGVIGGALVGNGLVGSGLGIGPLHEARNNDARSPAGSLVEDELLAAHLRGLIAPQPFDIASSDNHVVKPWFNGKTVIAPVTPDFKADGYPLVGGRVDVIGGKPVPVMIYKRRQHTISVTVTVASSTSLPAQTVVDGTNVMRWKGGDLTYWAVSDLNSAELSAFVDLFRKQLPPPG